jgi:hypothetical protein
MLLRVNGQGRELLVVVLNLQGSTVGDQGAIRQTDTQRGSDLGAFYGKRIVILPISIAGDYKVILQNLKRFSCYHVDRKK